MKKIVVHGATGAQGGPVAAALRAAGHSVTGISRSAAADDTSLVAADLSDQASLEAAYAGADAVFLHLPIAQGPDDVASWVPPTLGALAASNVSRVVLSTSGVSATESGDHPMLVGAFEGTKALVAALEGVVDSVVTLAPRLFLENLALPFVAGPAAAEGVLAYPIAADKPISWISHLDVARAAVAAFEDSTPAGVYDLGINPITGPELAEQIGRGLGREVTYEAISPAEFTNRATPLMGADVAAGIGGLYEAFATDPTRSIPSERPQLATEDRLTVEAWATKVLAS